MDESLNIVRHFFNTFNTNPDNDHWYPQVCHMTRSLEKMPLKSVDKKIDLKDPEKRRNVDEWLEWAGSGKGNWKTAIHLTIRFQFLELLHIGPQSL